MAAADPRVLNFPSHLRSISLSQLCLRIRVQSENCVFSSAIFAQLPVRPSLPKAQAPSHRMRNCHVIILLYNHLLSCLWKQINFGIWVVLVANLLRSKASRVQHGATRLKIISRGTTVPSALLHSVSLWYLGDETECRVGTPYTDRNFIDSLPKAKVDQSESVFLQKTPLWYVPRPQQKFGDHSIIF